MNRSLFKLAFFAAIFQVSAADANVPQQPNPVSVVAYKVAGQTIQGGRAEGIVDAPYAAVKAIVEDYEHYPKFMPYCSMVRLLARRGASASIYLEARIFNGSVVFWSHLRVSAKQAVAPAGAPPSTSWLVEANRIQGNIKHAEAHWELIPLNGGQRTKVIFHLMVAPYHWPLPDSLLTHENLSVARQVIEQLRVEVVRRNPRRA